MTTAKPKLEACKKCGSPWIGLDKCECGWRPDTLAYCLKMVGALFCVAGIASGVFLFMHYYDWFPDNASADSHLAKGDDEFSSNYFKEAVTEYQAGVSCSPRRVDLRKKLAIALFSDRRPGEALQQYAAVYELSPKDSKIKQEYSFMLEQNGKYAEAATVLGKSLGGKAPDDVFRYHLAELYEYAGQFQQAESLYRAYSKAKPQANGSWLSIARLQERNKKPKEAIATLREGLAYCPNDAVIRQRLGIILADINQKEEAIKELTASAEAAPGLAEYNSGLIASLTGDGKQHEYVIPLRRRGNAFMVEAVLNERRRVNLLVDSGSEILGISPAVFKQLKMSTANSSPVVMRGVGGLAVTSKVMLPSVRVGMAKQVLVPAAIMPADTNIDGLLGMSFLSRYEFSIDGQHDTLILRRRPR